MRDSQHSFSLSQPYPCLLGDRECHEIEILVRVLISALECDRERGTMAFIFSPPSPEIGDAVSRYLKLMFLSVLSFWAISLIINGSTWVVLEMMLKLNQASLAILERGFEC